MLAGELVLMFNSQMKKVKGEELCHIIRDVKDSNILMSLAFCYHIAGNALNHNCFSIWGNNLIFSANLSWVAFNVTLSINYFSKFNLEAYVLEIIFECKNNSKKGKKQKLECDMSIEAKPLVCDASLQWNYLNINSDISIESPLTRFSLPNIRESWM